MVLGSKPRRLKAASNLKMASKMRFYELFECIFVSSNPEVNAQRLHDHVWYIQFLSFLRKRVLQKPRRKSGMNAWHGVTLELDWCNQNAIL